MRWFSRFRSGPVVAALLVALALVGCGTAPEDHGGNTSSGVVTSETSTPPLPAPPHPVPLPPPTPEPSPPPEPPRPTQEQGEVWEWAIGRSMDDPAISPYLANLMDDDAGGGAMVKELGFELLLASSGTVTGVMLVNDERSLGYSENTFAAYDGRLPGGLTWDMNTAEVLEALGEPDTSYTEGYGAEATLTYADVDGHQVVVSLAARHQSDIPTSPIHTMTVTAPG
ncbi:MAG TPA: hypothetical protein VES95_10465 [Dermatophilaceae bacterium]|nr:hypothetical protein [Dermatophilaceae bacterium]